MTTAGKARLKKVVSGMGKDRVLVFGDIMLDEYVWGSVGRISPEAPVPVVQVERLTAKLGGAANVALNLMALGHKPILVGVIGRDDGSIRLKKLLQKSGLELTGLIPDDSRPTTVKTRVIAHNQQVVRTDWESTQEVSAKIRKKILDILRKSLKQVKAVIISDYGKGTATKEIISELVTSARKCGVFVAADPKETHFRSYQKVSVITPNHHEASFISGRRISSEKILQEVGWDLLLQLGAESILITRGEKGMALFERGGNLTLIPALARQVYDVTGAGDTVISSLVSAVCAGANLKEAAWLSNLAAGIVIREIGTAQVSKAELLQELNRNSRA